MLNLTRTLSELYPKPIPTLPRPLGLKAFLPDRPSPRRTPRLHTLAFTPSPSHPRLHTLAFTPSPSHRRFIYSDDDVVASGRDFGLEFWWEAGGAAAGDAAAGSEAAGGAQLVFPDASLPVRRDQSTDDNVVERAMVYMAGVLDEVDDAHEGAADGAAGSVVGGAADGVVGGAADGAEGSFERSRAPQQRSSESRRLPPPPPPPPPSPPFFASPLPLELPLSLLKFPLFPPPPLPLLLIMLRVILNLISFNNNHFMFLHCFYSMRFHQQSFGGGLSSCNCFNAVFLCYEFRCSLFNVITVMIICLYYVLFRFVMVLMQFLF